MSEEKKKRPKVSNKKGKPGPTEVNWRVWSLAGLLFFISIPLGLLLWNPYTGVQSVRRRVAALEGRADLEVVAPAVLQGILGSELGLWSKVAGGTQIMGLHLDQSKVTDQDLRILRSTPFLKRLHLSSTGITDAGLANLKYAANLEELAVANTIVTEKGLADLPRLTKLQSLNLDGTHVTEALVDVLKTAPSVNRVSLSRAVLITPEVLEKIRSSLPGVEILPKAGAVPAVPAAPPVAPTEAAAAPAVPATPAPATPVPEVAAPAPAAPEGAPAAQ